MTSTSLKSPRSGTWMSVGMSCLHAVLLGHRIRLVRIDVEFFQRGFHGRHVELAFIGKRTQRRHDDVWRVHFEMFAKLGARVAATVTVGAEHDVTTGDPLTYLIGHDAHVIRGRDER